MDKVDYIVDEGKAKIGRASTIVSVKEGELLIIREGPISKEEIENKIK